MTRVYLSGPISLGGTCSEDEEGAFVAVFARWARLLRARGFDVTCPTECEPQASWEDYMRLGIAAVCAADMVATLPRWIESRGAMLEVFVARQLGISVVPVNGLGVLPEAVTRSGSQR